MQDLHSLVFSPLSSKYPDHPWKGDDIRRAIHEHDGHEVSGRPIRWCRNCSDRSFGIWVTVIQSNGVRVTQLRCVRCCKIDMVCAERKVYPLSQGPVLRNYVDDDLACERCDSDGGVELHHWAPRHLFHDAWSWPMAYLCPACHREWHQIIKNHQ